MSNELKTEVFQTSGTLVYVLHKTGKFYKGQEELCNKFSCNVQPDYSGGVTVEEAKELALQIADSMNVSKETGKTPRQLADENKVLLEALKGLMDAINPHSHPNRNWDVNERHIGSKTMPTDESIISALKAIENATKNNRHDHHHRDSRLS